MWNDEADERDDPRHDNHSSDADRHHHKTWIRKRPGCVPSERMVSSPIVELPALRDQPGEAQVRPDTAPHHTQRHGDRAMETATDPITTALSSSVSTSME